jgi:hypothetical protein
VSKHCAAEYRIYAAFLARGNVRAAGQSGRFHLEEATIADLHRAIRAKQITAIQLLPLYFERIEPITACV